MRLRVDTGTEILHFSPADSPVSVGRAATCRVRLSHPLVSRQHGQLRWRDDAWLYEDHSRHGSVVSAPGADDRRLSGQSAVLPPACELRLTADGEARIVLAALAEECREPAREVYRRGVGALGRGDPSRALEAFLDLARRDPPIVEAFRQAAECLEVLGRAPEALLWAARYAAERPRDPTAWRLLARLHGERGDLADGRACLARARELDPADPETVALEARLAAAEPAAAVLACRTAEVLGPSVPHLLETPHFAIRCDFAVHGRQLPDLAKGLEAAVQRTAPYVRPPEARIPVELLARPAAPGEAPPLGDRAAAADCGAGGIRIYLPPARSRAWGDAPYLVGLALHEVVHASLLRVSPRFPWWVHEGLAQWVSLGGAHEGWLPAPDDPPDLSRYEGPPRGEEVETAYALAHFALEALHRDGGAEGVRRLLECLAAEPTAETALARCGTSSRLLGEAAWRLWRRRAPPDPIDATTLSHPPGRSS